MCGICGILSKKPFGIDAHEAVIKMCDGMVHRGPDDEGTFSAPSFEMGMRRLSIIDLTGGRQPLYNEDKTVVVIANGEIYNYLELRQALEARGHVFRTNSDCEAIVHLYEEFDIDFAKRLRGMFSIAIWDVTRRQLILARDRMAEKPLYLFETDEILVFASELKGMLRSGVVPFDLDHAAINLYFHYNYIPEPYTAIKNVFKFPPAHIRVFDADTASTNLYRYWDMRDAQPLEAAPDEALLTAMRDTMSIITRADVPVGLALSGGIDSNLIGALVKEIGLNNIHTIGVGYRGCPECDEREDARAFAKMRGLQFHSVEVSTDEMTSFFPELVYWLDDPVSDVSGYGYYALMKRAREIGIPVMLQGHGADELFWGYPWVKEGSPLSDEKAKRLLDSGKASPGDVAAMIFIERTPGFQAAKEALPIYFTDDFQDRVAIGPSVYEFFSQALPWPDPDTDMTRLICEIYLAGNGIVQGDRLGMASSVEQRLPLVDHQFVETVIGLRKFESDNPLPAKARFKDALKPILPSHILNRAKRGFAPPLNEWMHALRREYGYGLRNGYLVHEGILRADRAMELLEDRHLEWRGAPLFYKMLVLEFWCRAMNSVHGVSCASASPRHTFSEGTYA